MKPKNKFYRLNFFIQAKTVRLLDGAGKQIGIVTKEEAIRKARELGIDVVEIAPNAQPPVCKLIDYKKFKYLEAKKDREEKRKQKHVTIKEIRLTPFIGTHDIDVRAQHARQFLVTGNQVKITLLFKGRQITRQDFGHKVIRDFLQLLPNSKIVRPPHMEGKMLVAMISPVKKI